MSEKSNVKSELKTGSSFDKKKTETEQLYDELTDVEQTQEETEEQAEQEDEEIQSEEELEIESYQSKIDELDAKLAAHEAQYIDAMKREQMKKAHYSEVQIERYLSHIEGESETEIKESVSNLTLEIPPSNGNFADPSPFNGAKQKPVAADHSEIGRRAFDRVRHKIFPHSGGRK